MDDGGHKVDSTFLGRVGDNDVVDLVCACGWQQRAVGATEMDARLQAEDAIAVHLGIPFPERPGRRGAAREGAAFLVGLALIVGSVAGVVWLGASAWGWLTGDDGNGPTGQYTPEECAALRATALTDGSPDQEDALTKYTVHCE
ncbi:hypothetical protein [Nocardioides sp. SR21]|uniref:hypothetical protein n=1 Tax=Nocardioides sp. SR21 TaxID=2919501 RepID=UPI001FA9CB38|nr:hypothetical protein [Nocardioides sp. SR21]